MRLRKIKQAEEILHQHPKYVLFHPEEFCGKWKEVFQNDSPIFLEIGMGKGNFILELARRNPNINYIGIEKEQSVLIRAVQKMEENELPNVIFLPVDAFLLDQYFEENELDGIYLNFSDPWPKTRHAKRRLTNQTLLSSYKSRLKQNKAIEMKTDNRHLFEYSLLEFVHAGFMISKISLNLHEDEEDVITTEYEDKFIQKGNPIYFIEVKNEKI